LLVAAFINAFPAGVAARFPATAPPFIKKAAAEIPPTAVKAPATESAMTVPEDNPAAGADVSVAVPFVAVAEEESVRVAVGTD